MSRVITATPETFISMATSPANLTGVTYACWVKLSAYGTGGTFFVKDPAVYLGNLELNGDGTLFALWGKTDLGGISNRTVIDGGLGYVDGDTGFVTGGDPDIAANRATYTVNSSLAGAVLTVGIPDAGQGYAAGQTYTTTPGGSQPGIGSGLTIRADTLINQSGASAQSVEAIPLNTWTHVAMTYDSTTGLIHLYINGVECTYTGQYTKSTVLDDSTGPWYFGDDTFDFALDGASIAEIVIYNTKLTSVQVAALAASTTGATGSPLEYLHVCGDADPEPSSSGGQAGTLSTPAPAKGATNSPGYTACGSGPSTPGDDIVNDVRWVSRHTP